MIKSDIQLRIEELQELAIEIFVTKTKADAWLNKKNLTLGTTAISMAETDYGTTEVNKKISAIGFGGVV